MINAMNSPLQQEVRRLEHSFQGKAKAIKSAINTALQRKVRSLEDMLIANGRGQSQAFEYDSANGNLSIVPVKSVAHTASPFSCVFLGAMTHDFGGGDGEWNNEFTRKIRRLEEALRANANGDPQSFEYNTETGNMNVVPYNNTTQAPRAFSIINRDAMAGHFGGNAGDIVEVDGGSIERGWNPDVGPGPSYGMLMPHVFSLEFGCDIQVASLDADDLVSRETSPMTGFAYTLEDEGVVRIVRGRSDPHAKGREDRVVFVAEDHNIPPEQKDARYVVRIGNNDTFAVSEMRAGSECPIPTVMVVPRLEDHFKVGIGLMESPLLKEGRVLLFGCGSMGGELAMHLAMAGVGHICLADPDRVEASNLSRLRDAGIADVGRRKVDVLAECIRGKNPNCQVKTVAQDITKDSKLMAELLAITDVVAVATDNRASKILIAQELQKAGKPCVYARCSTRAESGDCFVFRPGEACYKCLYGATGNVSEEVDDWASAKKAGRLAAYCTPDDMADFAILPGISADISAITAFAARLVFWELANGISENPYFKFNEEFSRFNYFLYVNRREKYFRNDAWAPFDNAGQRPCPQRWYGAVVPKRDDCPCCGGRATELDTGEAQELAEFVGQDITGQN